MGAALQLPQLHPSWLGDGKSLQNVVFPRARLTATAASLEMGNYWEQVHCTLYHLL